VSGKCIPFARNSVNPSDADGSLGVRRDFWGEGTADGKNIQFHVKTRVPLDYTGTVDGDTMKETMPSWYVRGRFLREKELGSVDRKPRHNGLVRICARGSGQRMIAPTATTITRLLRACKIT
jgi:hypothetical protein